MGQLQTRTTRTPAFWEYLPPPHDYANCWFKSYPEIRQVKVIHFKKLPKIQNLEFTKPLHVTHLLKLLEKICKHYIVEDTERKRFCLQTDGQTDLQTDGRTTWNQYTPLSTSLKRGYQKQCFDLFRTVTVFFTAFASFTPITWPVGRCISEIYHCNVDGSGHERAAVLLPGFSINW